MLFGGDIATKKKGRPERRPFNYIEKSMCCLVAGTCTNQNLRGPQLEMVAGPGSNLNLHDSQVKMVAGGHTPPKLRSFLTCYPMLAKLAAAAKNGLFRAAA